MISGVVFSLCAAIGFGASAVLARVGMQYMRSTTATLASLLASTTVALMIAFTFRSEEIFSLSSSEYVWFLLIGVMTFPIARLLNYTGVKLIGVTRGSVIVGSAPLFAIATAVTMGNESVNVTILIGTVTIVCGLGIILAKK